MIVLDTSVLIELERNNSTVQKALEDIQSRQNESIAITAPTYSEYLFGILYAKPHELEQAKRDLEHYPLLHTTKNSSILCATLKYQLGKRGAMIPDIDLFIAAIALDQQATLISCDKHFQNIRELPVVII